MARGRPTACVVRSDRSAPRCCGPPYWPYTTRMRCSTLRRADAIDSADRASRIPPLPARSGGAKVGGHFRSPPRMDISIVTDLRRWRGSVIPPREGRPLGVTSKQTTRRSFGR
jgi:hypothetical protein